MIYILVNSIRFMNVSVFIFTLAYYSFLEAMQTICRLPIPTDDGNQRNSISFLLCKINRKCSYHHKSVKIDFFVKLQLDPLRYLRFMACSQK